MYRAEAIRLRCFATVITVGLYGASLFMPGAMAAEQVVTLKSGTPLFLTLDREVSSETVTKDETIPLSARANLVIKHHGKFVLIRRGAPATAVLTRLKKRGRLGRPGQLELTLEQVQAVDGTWVPLRGKLTLKGEGHRGSGLILPILCPPLGLLALRKGKAATLPAGLRVHAQVDKTVQITVP